MTRSSRSYIKFCIPSVVIKFEMEMIIREIESFEGSMNMSRVLIYDGLY